jgi:Plasmid maintenance system killer protein
MSKIICHAAAPSWSCFIDAAVVFDHLSIPPNFGFHALTGNRAGTYAMVVTKNWRLIFTKVDDQTIADLDLEDYH